MAHLKKLMAIDLLATEPRAEKLWFPHCPAREFVQLCGEDGVDVSETYEMCGAKVIEYPAGRSRSDPSGFRQSDDQSLMIKTLILAMKLRPDFFTT